MKPDEEMFKESERKVELVEINKNEAVAEKKKELEKPVIKDFLKSDVS